jgi:hypothetical protein
LVGAWLTVCVGCFGYLQYLHLYGINGMDSF